jgi:hypothetical protein
VYIFDFHVAAPANKDEEHRLEVVQELKGEQSGEYFGAALCVVDVNGDGLDDILVGAPRHAGKTWDQGQLYVHLTSVIPTKSSVYFLFPVLFCPGFNSR